MKTFYVTFGLGSILGGNYLVAYAPDEDTLRLRLNADKLPWCGVHDYVEKVERYGLEPLKSHYEAVSEHNSGPCGEKEL